MEQAVSAWLRRHPFVPVMQATADGKRDQFAWPIDWLRLLAGDGSVAVQALVRSSNVIVLADEFVEQSLKMVLVQHNNVIEKFPTQRSTEPLNERVLPRASECRANFLDTAAIEERPDSVAVLAVVVAEQVPGLLSERHRLTKLLDDPFHGRATRNSEVDDLRAAIVENHKDIQDVESQRGDGEEVNGPGHVQMVAQERQPGRGPIRGTP